MLSIAENDAIDYLVEHTFLIEVAPTTTLRKSEGLVTDVKAFGSAWIINRSVLHVPAGWAWRRRRRVRGLHGRFHSRLLCWLVCWPVSRFLCWARGRTSCRFLSGLLGRIRSRRVCRTWCGQWGRRVCG